MDVAFDLIVLVVVVVAVGGACRRWDLPAPLVLVVVGLAGSFVPRFEDVELDPELILVGLLPPLLYAAAIRTSILDLRHNVAAIAQLSVGLVLFTTLGVGLVAWWLLPIPLAAGLALGAVVAPPDAVSTTSIARRVGLPRRVITILEGESLFNDGTALVAFGAAVAALDGGVTAGEIGLDFLVSAAGGAGAGVLVAAVVGSVRRRVDDVLTDTSIALVAPFAAYLAAEEVHASGVLAVVVTGVLLGHKAAILQSASARVFERSTWATIQFLLEHAVFLLIGLQVRTVVDGLDDSTLPTGRIVAITVATFAAVVVLRVVWVFATSYLPPIRPPGAPPMPWRFPAVVSWAGMRGVVTLAAAFALPVDTPERPVLVLVAFAVTAGTLLVQGWTLPSLIRRLRLRPPDPDEDVLQEAEVYERAGRAGLRRLASADVAGVPDEVVARLRTRGADRAHAAWERLGGTAEAPSQAYARLRREMLRAEREEVLAIRAGGLVDHEVLQRVLDALDVEESVLEVAAGTRTTADRVTLLRPAAGGRTGCDHLQAAVTIPPPRTPEGCEDCLVEGTTWVHLRLCLACGHVGCCDSSPRRHAEAHAGGAGHPVVQSFEIGEAWRWCYVDEVLG